MSKPSPLLLTTRQPPRRTPCLAVSAAKCSTLAPIEVDLPTIQERQIRVHGAATCVAEDFEAAVEVVSRNEAALVPLVSAAFDLEEVEEGFRRARDAGTVTVIPAPAGR